MLPPYRLETIAQKLIAGKSVSMSVTENKTAELWRSFMPLKKQITNKLNEHLFSIELYPPGYFSAFNPNTPFQKWAGVEVESFEDLSAGFEPLIIPGGTYAVFQYKGIHSAAFSFYQQIYTSPKLTLDDRPHFAVMGSRYKNDSADSEEEIFIPTLIDCD